MASDAHGNPLCFEVTGGQVHDNQVASKLIDQVQGEILIADKGYDSEALREYARLKHYPSISTRFEKLARNFKSVLMFTCTIHWLKLQIASQSNEDTP